MFPEAKIIEELCGMCAVELSKLLFLLLLAVHVTKKQIMIKC